MQKNKKPINSNDLLIIRNCSHFTNVQTGILIVDNEFKKTIKKAFTAEGASSLESEFQGAKSFCEQMKVDPSSYILDYQNNSIYSELHLKYIHGEIGDCHAGLDHNFDRLLSLIEFYNKNIINNGIGFIHGDFSVSNVIFSKSDVIWIIDWENYNTSLPLYYDLIYCITELALFTFAGKKSYLGTSSILKYWELFSQISNMFELPNEIKQGPSKWLRTTVSNSVDSGNRGLIKCPFIQNNVEVINELDNKLCASRL